jgi:hypothetical protein
MVVQPPGFVVAAKLIDGWLSAPSSRCFHHVNDVGFFIFELVIVHADARVTLLRAIEFQFKRSNGPSSPSRSRGRSRKPSSVPAQKKLAVRRQC